jgi:hypothetical protein
MSLDLFLLTLFLADSGDKGWCLDPKFLTIFFYNVLCLSVSSIFLRNLLASCCCGGTSTLGWMVN